MRFSLSKILIATAPALLLMGILVAPSPLSAAPTQQQINTALENYSRQSTALEAQNELNRLNSSDPELARAMTTQIDATMREFNSLPAGAERQAYLDGLPEALRVIAGNTALHDNTRLREIRSAVGTSALNQLPAATSQAVQQSNTLGTQMQQIQQGGYAGAGDDSGCGLSNFSFAVCASSVIYWIGPGLASYVVYAGAYIFSIAVQLSLNSTAYALEFLSAGWTTVRDLANMSFIFILIFISLTIMLRAETTGTVKQLIIVIIIALLVNFSFFFTRVIIDGGNILAVQFYNAIPAEDPVTRQTIFIGNSNTKDLTAGIMEAVKIQNLYGRNVFDQAQKSCGTAGSGVMCGLIVTTVVYLAVAAMFWMLFFSFLQVGIKFILRIVALWFLLIASPLAFVARTLTKGQPYFTMWWQYLIKFSLYPAIFLFMFFMLTKFTGSLLRVQGQDGNLFHAIFNAGTGTAVNTDSYMLGVASAIAAVGIRMGLVIALMYVALHVSEWVVKEGSSIAGKVGGWNGWAGGLTRGAVRYGPGWATGAAYRQTIGRGANRVGTLLTNSRWANDRSTLFGKALGTVGYRLNRNAVQPLKQTSLGTVASNWNERQEFLEERRHTMEENMENRAARIKARDEARELAELNTKWDPLQKNAKALEKDIKVLENSGPLTAAQQLELATKKNDKSTFDAEMDTLRGRREQLIGNTGKVEGSHIVELKSADLESVIKFISDKQLKAIKESNKFSLAQKEHLEKEWHEQSSKAPLESSKEQMKKLGDIHSNLNGLNINLAKLGSYTKPTGPVNIDLGVAKSLKKELEDENKKQEAIRDDRTLDDVAGKLKRTIAGKAAKELKSALEKVEKLEEQVTQVPEDVGNTKPEGEFEYKV